MSRRHTSWLSRPLLWRFLPEHSTPGASTFVPSAPVPRPRRKQGTEQPATQTDFASPGRVKLSVSVTVALIALAVTNHLTGGALSRWDARATSEPSQPTPPPFNIKGAWRDIGAHSLPVNSAPADAPQLDGKHAEEPDPKSTTIPTGISSREPNAAPAGTVAGVPPQGLAPPSDGAQPTEQEVKDQPPATQANVQAHPDEKGEIPDTRSAPADVAPSEHKAPSGEAMTNQGQPSLNAAPAVQPADHTTPLVAAAPAPASTPPSGPAVDAALPAPSAVAQSADKTSPRERDAEPTTSAPPLPRKKPMWIVEQSRPKRAEPLRPLSASLHRPVRPQPPPDAELDLLPNSGLFNGLGHASP